MCGENGDISPLTAAVTGSPPRVRGKPRQGNDEGSKRGIPPACAGKTLTNCMSSFRNRDHPRVCGENFHGGRRMNQVVGSPPRMRGKPAIHREKCLAPGIPPAHAGKTRTEPRGVQHGWGYPHACGENNAIANSASFQQGSPPRMRGKPVLPRCICVAAGITPACAGKTEAAADRYAARADHPRVCGENRCARRGLVAGLGSPPRVRGKQRIPPLRIQAYRITPACAGKTSGELLQSGEPKDHPRVCGENSLGRSSRCRPSGSPPRVRGKPGLCRY